MSSSISCVSEIQDMFVFEFPESLQVTTPIRCEGVV